jgi:hypothetical protein
MEFSTRTRVVIQIGILCAAITSSGRAGVLYPRLESSFTLTNSIPDPFDYTAADVKVQISQPDSTVVTLPAFFDGGSTWRVRHSPAKPGLYQISAITLNGSAVSVSNLQPGSWTMSGAPFSPGFVGVDPANSNRFVTGNGRRYLPLGHDVAWDVNSATNVVAILAKQGAAHENWARVWMDHWDNKNLDWPKVGSTFGTLSLPVAQKWDAIVSAADQAGISFQMTLQHHGQYSSTTDPNWPQNPYNSANGGFLTNAAQFFTDPTAKSLTKRKLRYAVARWGYSPAIMAWELFNEVQFTDAAQNGQWTNVAAWHDEMAQFIRSQDVYHHLITTSSQLDQQIWNQCDYYSHHDYPSDLISALRDPAGIPSGQPVKPIFGGECGKDNTPYYGVHAPHWAGLMSAQSGPSQQWYWDQVDADNSYNIFRAGRDFVLMSGLADQDYTAKSAPHVTCPVTSMLAFAPGGGWASASQTTFTIGDNAPDGIGTLPSYLQGSYHKAAMNMPNGYTFLVNYQHAGTFSVQVLIIAQSGASLVITVDNATTNRIDFPSTPSDTTTNYTMSVSLSAGPHTLQLTDPGLDWVNLGNITLDPYTPILGCYQVANTNYAALWVWHRTNIYNPSASATVSGSLSLTGLVAGAYSGVWWNTFAGVPLSNFNFTVTGSNPVALSIPPVLRSAAFFAAPPPQASLNIPSLTLNVATNSAATTLPLTITNNGGLPLAWSLSVTGISPIVYSAINSTQPGGPFFAWKDISAIGRNLTSTLTALTGKGALDEGISGPIGIGFGFPFFSGGQTPDIQTQLYLSPNGFVSFSPFAGDTSTNRTLPNALAPSNSIAFFWTDLDLTSAGNIYCATDSIAGTFTLQFQSVPIKGTSTNVTCQLILKSSGEILMQYKTVGVSNTCVVGVQNAARSQGSQIAYRQSYLQSGFAVRLTPTPWFAFDSSAGLTPRASTDTVNLTLDPSGLSPGTYSATLLTRTADPALPINVQPVNLNVLLPIDLWRLNNFGSSANTGNAADSADPDHDGLANLIEYALGLNPNTPNPDPITWSLNSGHLTLSYKRPHPAPPDISSIAEVTTAIDSGIWNSGPAYTSQSVVNNGDGTETVTVTDLLSIGSAPAHYLRVRFSR